MFFLQSIKDVIARRKLFRYNWTYGWKKQDLKREIALFWDTPLPKERVKNENAEQYEQLIAVNSFGGRSGSAIVLDFLNEFDEVSVLGGVYDPKYRKGNFACTFWAYNNGVLSLEESIFSKKFFYTNLGALNFSINVLNNFFSSIWIYDEYYLQRSKEFLFNLIDCHWRWSAGAFSSNPKSEYTYIPSKYPKRFEFNDPKTNQIVENTWKNFTKEEYRNKAKEYIKDIFKHIPSKKNLVASLLVDVGDFDENLIEDYFDDLKIIYVWSDPRDQYVRCRKKNKAYVPKDPHAFCARFKKLANGILNKKHQNLLLVRFEEFITNYDKISNQIIEFLGFKHSAHTRKFMYFNPKISVKKIGAYKEYKDQEAIKIIEQELKEYCWNY